MSRWITSITAISPAIHWAMTTKGMHHVLSAFLFEKLLRPNLSLRKALGHAQKAWISSTKGENNRSHWHWLSHKQIMLQGSILGQQDQNFEPGVLWYLNVFMGQDWPMVYGFWILRDTKKTLSSCFLACQSPEPKSVGSVGFCPMRLHLAAQKWGRDQGAARRSEWHLLSPTFTRLVPFA